MLTTADATFDPRTTLARPDLAEQALEGLVRALAYRPTRAMHAAVPLTDIHAGADPASERLDQLLFGEVFDVLDQKGDRLWGRARRDGLVGWVSAAGLKSVARPPTHRVSAVDAALPLNALVSAGADIAPGDTAPIGEFESDPVAVAERLLGVSHSLGARSSVATDCSGLVQQALYACGMAGPRFPDQQAELGQAVDRPSVRRGDLVIWLAAPGDYSWTGHSALMLDADSVIHATGHHGAVVIEAFADADARYRADGFDAPVFRRL